MYQPTDNFKCPNCAETVKSEAKSCRFCGQILNGAVKRGFPEFYSRSSDDLSLEWLLHDYVKHFLPEHKGSLTAPSVIGNLLSYGELDEYEDYKKIRYAMRSREAELAGGEIDGSPDLPDTTPDRWSETKPEQKALYLTRRYVEIAQDYTKLFSDKDMRQDPAHMEWAISELTKLVDLADDTSSSMEAYADHFRSEIRNCSEQLDLLRQSKTMTDGRSASERLDDALGRVDASTPPSQSDDFEVIFAGDNIAVTNGTVIAIKKPLDSPKHVIDLQNTWKSQVYGDIPIKGYGFCLVGAVICYFVGSFLALVGFVCLAVAIWYFWREAAVLNVVEHGGNYLEVKMKKSEADAANTAIQKRLKEIG
jgi:hypothetical protein